MNYEYFSLTTPEFNLLRKFLYLNSGLELTEKRKYQLELVVGKRLEVLRLASVEEYLHYLMVNVKRVEEQQLLIDSLTITETYFFRNKSHFDLLQHHILPQIAQNSPEKKLKIWSAGCSSGEEPYSIAMIIHELSVFFYGWKIEILGTDVNQTRLHQAKAGVYTERAIKMTSSYYLRKYFKLKDDLYHLNDNIKAMVDFRKFNLIHEPYPLQEMKDYNIIFCRNVTIYFKKSSTERVIHNFYKSLKDDGCLLIGHSESLHNINDEFRLSEKDGVYYYLKSPAPQNTDERGLYTDQVTPLPVTLTATDTKSLLEKGLGLSARGEYEEALFCFNEAIKAEPYLVEPYLCRGQLYADRRVYSEALSSYEQALKLAPLNAEVHFLMGLVYWEKEDFAQAADFFKKAKYLDAGFCLPYYYLGLWYEKEVRYNRAYQAFAAALKIIEKVPKQIKTTSLADFKIETIKQTCLNKMEQLERLSD